MRALAAAVVLLPTFALAQSEGEVVDDRPVMDRCFWGRGASVSFRPELAGSYRYGFTGSASPSPSSSGSSGSSGVPSLGGGGGKGPEALLVAAVVVAAALPIIVYIADSPADEVTMARYNCPLFELDAWGGAEGPTGTPTWAAVASTRFRLTSGLAGLVAQVDASPSSVSGFSVEAMLRPPPRQHLEGGLAAGFRRSAFDTAVRDGFEVALPHEYVLVRDGPRSLGVELRPHVFFHQRGVDLGVEAAVRVPVTDFLTFRAGARAFTFDWHTVIGFNAGLALHL
ncbi:MAG: hypothetical protein K1X89_02055 [Myxococcaceae bacterium]|nr:hypothetical protein [Myxococcaceae bacterium]